MPSLKRIRLEGFKSIKEMDLELRSLNVLIGANGAGKTNFISAFALLNQIAEENLQNFVAESGGANRLLYFGQKVTDEILIDLGFERNGARFEASALSEELSSILAVCLIPAFRLVS